MWVPQPGMGFPHPEMGYPPARDGVPPGIGQQMEYLVRGGQYASCVHAGGLSFRIYVLLLCRKIHNDSFSVLNVSNIWYVSDYGSDDNDCHSASAPCKNLQTVLDRATDGADIYVTSDTLSLDYIHLVTKFPGAGRRVKPEMRNCCQLRSSISYSLSSWKNNQINITCTGQYY